jgi:hypothetical protein
MGRHLMTGEKSMLLKMLTPISSPGESELLGQDGSTITSDFLDRLSVLTLHAHRVLLPFN